MQGGSDARALSDDVMQALLDGAAPDEASRRLIAREPASAIESEVRAHFQELR